MKLSLVTLILISIQSWADPIAITDASKIKIDLTKPIVVDYQSKSWNRTPNEVDSAFLILKDTISKQLVSLEMIETATNTAHFVGTFRLDRKQKNTEATLEIYLPPQNTKIDSTQIQVVAQMINDGILIRKPYFYRQERGQQRITIYDSKTQALEAYRYFVRTGQSSQVINPNLLENTARSQTEASMFSSQNLSEMESLDTIAQEEMALQQRRYEKLQQVEKLSEASKKLRQVESTRAAQKGLDLYKKDQFEMALKEFEKAIELDPMNKDFYFQYGVTLFRLNQFEKSIAYLNLSNTPNPEKNLFLGLNYLKLKKPELAYSSFSSIQSDPNLGATAKFYMGIIDYNNETYESAQKLFEEVLEQSKDPQIDQAAENYIEEILNIKRFKEFQTRKWTFTGTLGGTYDSNILTVSPNAVPTDLSGFRASYTFNLEYRPIFTPSHEFLGQISVSDLYSVDRSFRGSSTLQNVDPQVIQFVLPYRWKGKIQDKVSQIGVTPVWRYIQMNADAIGTREEILSSLGIITDLSLAQTEKLNSLYALEVRQDNSKTISLPYDNQDALYVGLSTTQTYFFDGNDKSKAFLGDFGVATNNAQGQNQKFHAITLGGGYLQPGYFQSLWIAKLTFTHRNFHEHLTGRKDNVLNATILAQRQINSELQSSFMFGVTNNQSTLSILSYTQFILMGQLTWQKAF